MRPLISFTLALAVTLSGLCMSSTARADQTDDQRIEELIVMLSADFDAGRHRHNERLNGIAEDKLSTWASRMFGPMDAPAVGKHVMLSSSYNRYDGEWRYDPFEFLVWTLEVDPTTDDILMTPQSPIAPESYKRLARIPSILDGIKPGALIDGVGGAVCPIRWSKTDYGFYGTSKDCLVMSVSQYKILNWNWTYTLREDRLEIELAGRDKDTGAFLFGTPEGRPSYLYRLSDISEYEAGRYMLENRTTDEVATMAEELLMDVLKEKPNHAAANLILASAYIARGAHSDAKPHVSKAEMAKSELSAADQSLLNELQAKLE